MFDRRFLSLGQRRHIMARSGLGDIAISAGPLTLTATGETEKAVVGFFERPAVQFAVGLGLGALFMKAVLGR